MDKQYISDNKFYIILTIATLALIIGIVGLVIGLQRPTTQSLSPDGGINASKQLPPGTTDGIEIDPSTGNKGVVESPKKN